MTVTVLLFASYREAAGERELALELKRGATVRDAATVLEARVPGLTLKGALAAIGEDYAAPESPLREGDTLAFFPPVSGGALSQGNPAEGADEGAEEGRDSGGDFFLVTRQPLEPAALSSRIHAPEFGAAAFFVGTVRSPNAGHEVAYIDYEGYETMIYRQMARVAQEARQGRALGRLALAHRLGRLAPGEASIAVAVASAHRRDALSGCEFCIDRCKELLPVWKYEVAGERGLWVAGSSAAAEPL